MDAYIYNEANAMYDELVRWRRICTKYRSLAWSCLRRQPM